MMRINNLTYVKALWALWKLLYESNINTNDPYWQSASSSMELHWCLCSKNIISKHKTFIPESLKTKTKHRSTNNGYFFVIVVVQSLSGVRLFGTPWTPAYQASLSFTTSQSLHRLMLLSRWCHPTISSSVTFFSSCFQFFPASGSFLMSQLFKSDGQGTGTSALASDFPMNIQDWFSLGLTALISLQSKELSKISSNTTVQKHQSFGTQPSLWFNSQSIHDYWTNHGFEYMDICWQSNVSAF